MTSEEAAIAVQGTIIKTIILIIDDKPVACILRGDDRIDLNKIRELKRGGHVRLAKAKEVLEFTGYDIGSVPPFGWKTSIETIVDKSVEKIQGTIFAGGGSHYHLLKMEINDFLKLIKHLSRDLIVANVKE